MDLTPDQFAALVIDRIRRAIDGPLVAARFEALENRLADLDAAKHLKVRRRVCGRRDDVHAG
jgi:hypothetical protein